MASIHFSDRWSSLIPAAGDAVQMVVSGGVMYNLNGPNSSPEGVDWQEDLRSDAGGIIAPPYGVVWPSVDTMDAVAPVTITFTAG